MDGLTKKNLDECFDRLPIGVPEIDPYAEYLMHQMLCKAIADAAGSDELIPMYVDPDHPKEFDEEGRMKLIRFNVDGTYFKGRPAITLSGSGVEVGTWCDPLTAATFAVAYRLWDDMVSVRYRGGEPLSAHKYGSRYGHLDHISQKHPFGAL